jgi:hypothetical protein
MSVSRKADTADMGWGTFEPAGGWNGDHSNGVPIIVLSRHEPAPQFARMPLVTYLDDVETAMTRQGGGW